MRNPNMLQLPEQIKQLTATCMGLFVFALTSSCDIRPSPDLPSSPTLPSIPHIEEFVKVNSSTGTICRTVDNTTPSSVTMMESYLSHGSGKSVRIQILPGITDLGCETIPTPKGDRIDIMDSIVVTSGTTTPPFIVNTYQENTH